MHEKGSIADYMSSSLAQGACTKQGWAVLIFWALHNRVHYGWEHSVFIPLLLSCIAQQNKGRGSCSDSDGCVGGGGLEGESIHNLTKLLSKHTNYIQSNVACSNETFLKSWYIFRCCSACLPPSCIKLDKQVNSIGMQSTIFLGLTSLTSRTKALQILH